MSPNLGRQFFLPVSPRHTAEKSAGNKVRALIRTLSLVAASLWLLAGVACVSDTDPTQVPMAPTRVPTEVPIQVPTRASTQVPTPIRAPELSTGGLESRVAQALGSVPLEFSGQVVEFADYSGSRAATGLEEAVSAEVLFQLDHRTRERYHEGLGLHPHLRARIQRMNDRMGVDVFAFDQSIWSWQDGFNSPTFMLVEVPFDPEKVAGKLKALDYKKADHSGTAYYWLAEDFAPRRLTRPLGLPLNRVAFLDGRLATAPSTGIIEQLIDVHHGQSPSLLESAPHRALVEAAGEGLLGGVFIPPGWVVESWKTAVGRRLVGWLDRGTGDTRPVDQTDRGSLKARAVARLDRYLAGPGRWGQLSPYGLVLFGYRVQGDAEETVLALYYPDSAAAARDAGELEKRWNSFYYDPTGAHRESEDVPATLSCSPFSTTVVEGSGHSLLIGTCPVIRSEERDLTVKGPSLWEWLFETRELQFLVRDLDDLK